MPDCSSPGMSKVMIAKKDFMKKTKLTPIKKSVKSVKITKSVSVTNILTEKTTSEKKKTKML